MPLSTSEFQTLEIKSKTIYSEVTLFEPRMTRVWPESYDMRRDENINTTIASIYQLNFKSQLVYFCLYIKIRVNNWQENNRFGSTVVASAHLITRLLGFIFLFCVKIHLNKL